MEVHWFDIATGVGPDNLGAIVAALNHQAPQVARAWGPSSLLAHVVGTDPAAVDPAHAVKAYLLPNLDVADALGYHDVDPFGDPYIRVGVDVIRDHVPGDWVLGSVQGVSAVCSHEACELAVDPGCDSWGPADKAGDRVALESADPVQGYGYPVLVAKQVVLSDFVYPRWFGAKVGPPGHPKVGNFDFMGRLSSPRVLGAGGYEIIRAPDGSERQVFGEEFASWTQAAKAWPASRTYRRLHHDPPAFGSPRG